MPDGMVITKLVSVLEWYDSECGIQSWASAGEHKAVVITEEDGFSSIVDDVDNGIFPTMDIAKIMSEETIKKTVIQEMEILGLELKSD